MPSTAKLRRTLFALYREAGIGEAERHDVQEAWTGKPSLKDWTVADYDAAIAGLQRSLGQHRDPRAHVCEDRPAAEDEGGGMWATARQAVWIEDLCDAVEWKTGRQLGPRRYACSTVLRGDTKVLRRKRLHEAYDGAAPREQREAAWMQLTRQEASDLIKALRKAAQVYAHTTSDQ